MNHDQILKRFKEYRRLAYDKNVAELFNISPQDFVQRKKIGTLTDLIIEKSLNDNINLHWLITGTGPMKIGESAFQYKIPEEIPPVENVTEPAPLDLQRRIDELELKLDLLMRMHAATEKKPAEGKPDSAEGKRQGGPHTKK